MSVVHLTWLETCQRLLALNDEAALVDADLCRPAEAEELKAEQKELLSHLKEVDAREEHRLQA
jgi:hypothetical protein